MNKIKQHVNETNAYAFTYSINTVQCVALICILKMNTREEINLLTKSSIKKNDTYFSYRNGDDVAPIYSK